MAVCLKKVTPQAVIRGFCCNCNVHHELDSIKAQSACFQLMEQLEQQQSIDLFRSGQPGSHCLSTDHLFGESRGKMFGVLVGLDERGAKQRLYAFSGQYNGTWSVPGWVDPLFDPQHFDALCFEKEQQIEQIGEILGNGNIDDDLRVALKKKRREISRGLMKEIHELYTCCNFKGAASSLLDIFGSSSAPPSGTGDCCAPKLLHHAARQKLKPLSMAEFYWGRENLSSTRRHGRFYQPCIGKCKPILGYFLCGIECK